ncbi:unnamed protein product [Linum trigynum]|uniref:Uncharacterized protein n=1 Tax=Linum trigynum TaxID=586398 RepID=A0AAV2E1D3_9ROSI
MPLVKPPTIVGCLARIALSTCKFDRSSSPPSPTTPSPSSPATGASHQLRKRDRRRPPHWPVILPHLSSSMRPLGNGFEEVSEPQCKLVVPHPDCSCRDEIR